MLPLQITWVGDVSLSITDEANFDTYITASSCIYDYPTCSVQNITVQTEPYFSTNLDLQNTHLKLSYNSDKSLKNVTRKLTIQVLGSYLPSNLWLIELRVILAGIESKKLLEPEENLKWTLDWTGLNAYGGKVFGKTLAHIKVGYKFIDCPHTKWDHKFIELEGFYKSDTEGTILNAFQNTF